MTYDTQVFFPKCVYRTQVSLQSVNSVYHMKSDVATIMIMIMIMIISRSVLFRMKNV